MTKFQEKGELWKKEHRLIFGINISIGGGMVDAQGWGPCRRYPVRVQISSYAP